MAALEAQVKPDAVASSEVLGSSKYRDITSTIKDHQAELMHLKDLTSNLERTMLNLKVIKIARAYAQVKGILLHPDSTVNRVPV